MSCHTTSWGRRRTPKSNVAASGGCHRRSLIKRMDVIWYKAPWIGLNYILCFICITKIRQGQTLSEPMTSFLRTPPMVKKAVFWHWSLDGATIGMNQIKVGTGDGGYVSRHGSLDGATIGLNSIKGIHPTWIGFSLVFATLSLSLHNVWCMELKMYWTFSCWSLS